MRGSCSPPAFGGRTRGTPQQFVDGHSSASIAQPFSKRLPISVEAVSDCSLRRLDSSVSGGRTKSSKLDSSESSVGGVEAREM